MEHTLRLQRALERCEVQLCDIHIRADAVVLRNQRMDLAEDAHDLAVDENVGAAARMIARVLLLGDERRGLGVQLLEQRDDLALHREEVLVLAIRAEDQALRLIGEGLALDREIDLAQLIELDALVLQRKVSRQNVQHARQDDGPHDRTILAQRVDELDGFAQGRVCRDADGIKCGRRDEGIGDDLAVAHRARCRACRVLQLLRLGIAAHRRRAAHQRRVDLVIAIVPRDLFGEVCHAAEVGPPRGNLHHAVHDRDFLAPQIVDHVSLWNVGAEQGIDLGRLKRKGDRLRNIVQNVDHPVDNFACAEHLDQFACTVDRRNGQHRVDVLFKFRRSIGAHAEGQRGLADGCAEEVGRLEHDVDGIVHDLAVLAAHDAGQTDGLRLVRDDKHVGLELTDAAVERGERLVLARAADDDLAALDIAIIEGVHRLAVFDHDIVRDVDDVVDRSDAGGAQPLPHPLG